MFEHLFIEPMKFWINMFKHLLLCSNIYYCVQTLIVEKICSNIYYCVQTSIVEKKCSNISDIYYRVQTFIIVFRHLLLCANINSGKNMFKHLLLCSNIYYCVQTFIIVFK